VGSSKQSNLMSFTHSRRNGQNRVENGQEKQLFLDHTVLETYEGSTTDSFPGYSKSKTEAPNVLNDPNKDCYHTSSNPNGVSIGFGCPGMKISPSARDFIVWLIILVVLRLIAVIME
jgi:hypothetical protein